MDSNQYNNIVLYLSEEEYIKYNIIGYRMEFSL